MAGPRSSATGAPREQTRADARASRRGRAAVQRRLTAERDAAAVYRLLAARRSGEERELLLGLAAAEERHAEHWAAELDVEAEPHFPGLRARLLGRLGGRGSLLAFGLLERAERRELTDDAVNLPPEIAADEQVHAMVVRGLAERRRARASGIVRAAVFGASDGLVSNVALVLGLVGAGGSRSTVLLAGLAGLVAGALSMAAGEFISIRSQRDLLERAPGLDASMLKALHRSEEHELALVFRARGMDGAEADRRVRTLLTAVGDRDVPAPVTAPEPEQSRAESAELEAVGSATTAASTSFAAFALGAVIPVLPFLVAGGLPAIAVAVALSAGALLLAGAMTGLLAGASMGRAAARQLAVGAGVAAVTYGIGSALGVTIG